MDRTTLKLALEHLNELAAVHEQNALKYAERLTSADFGNLEKWDFENYNSMCETFDKLRSVKRSIKAISDTLKGSEKGDIGLNQIN